MPDGYMIIAGERRYRAAKICGLKEIDAVVKNYTNKQVAEKMDIEPEKIDTYLSAYSSTISIEGSIETAKVQILLRDFSREGIEEKKVVINTIAKMIEKTFNSSVKVKHTLQYLNMKEELDKNPNVVENLVKAYKKAEVIPVFTPIRGGTDGSRLTEMGMPCPNIFTGGHNFHSRFEWASLNQMFKALEVLIYLVKE
jgi:tripeptide aminopeptidase